MGVSDGLEEERGSQCVGREHTKRRQMRRGKGRGGPWGNDGSQTVYLGPWREVQRTLEQQVWTTL